MSRKARLMTQIALVIGVILCGCGTAQPPRYYSATATMALIPDTPPPPDSVEAAVPNAGDVFYKESLSLGFVLPDVCRKVASSPLGTANADADEEECRSLMAALETAAADRGYRVVNWNQLLGDPYRTAAEKKIDILFVIDDLNIRRKPDAQYQISDIRFAEQKEVGVREPYSMKNALALRARCKAAFSERNKPTQESPRDISGLTIALKMVSVQDGASRWFYRHSVETETKAAPDKVERDLYYLSRGHKKRGIGNIVVGGVFTAVGISSAVIGSRLMRYGTSFTKRNVGAALSWFTILPFSIALPMTAVGIYREAKPALYEAPEKVVCRNEPLPSNPFSTGIAAEADTAASLSLGDDTPAPAASSETKAPPAQVDNYLIDTLVTHFYTELNLLIRSSTSAPVTSPAQAPVTAQAPAVQATTTAQPPAMQTPATARPPASAVKADSPVPGISSSPQVLPKAGAAPENQGGPP